MIRICSGCKIRKPIARDGQCLGCAVKPLTPTLTDLVTEARKASETVPA